MTITEEPMVQPKILFAASADGMALKSQLGRLKPAYNAKMWNVPAAKNVRIDLRPGEMTLTVTNLDLWLRVTIPATTSDECSVLIAFETLAKFVSKVTAKSGKVIEMVQTTPEKVTLRMGKIAVHANTGKLEEWPVEPTVTSTARSFQLDVRAAAEVATVTANDPARPVLNTVCVDGSNYTGTDSYRLYTVESTTEESGPPFLLPARIALLLDKETSKGTNVIACTVDDESIEDKHTAHFLFTTIGDLGIYVRLSDGTFPNWRSLVPQNAHTMIEFERPDFPEAVAEIINMGGIIDATNHTPLRLDAIEGKQGRIMLSMKVGDQSTERECAGQVHHPVTLAFNAKFFAELVTGTNVCAVTGTEAAKPFSMTEPVYRPDVDGKLIDCGTRIRIIMPVRVG